MLWWLFLASGAVAATPPCPPVAADLTFAPPDTGAVADSTARDGTARDSTARTGPPVAASAAAAPAVADTGPARRPRAIEYSDAYARRLAVHRVASYTMLPLFGAEYALGERLLSSRPRPGWVRPTHAGVAYGLAALFTVNTVTGVWNLYDSRHDPAGRTRKWLHTGLLLASDAGFAYTGSIADRATQSAAGRTRHRNAALVSMGVATVGTAMMWLWKQ